MLIYEETCGQVEMRHFNVRAKVMSNGRDRVKAVEFFFFFFWFLFLGTVTFSIKLSLELCNGGDKVLKSSQSKQKVYRCVVRCAMMYDKMS